jgi:ATP-binding cassette subfamily F protein uup
MEKQRNKNKMALVDLIDISKQYDEKVLLKNVSFNLNKDERVAIVGKNGSGKSTFMKIIQSLTEPDEGRCVIQNGLDIEMLAQNPQFQTGLTVSKAIENELVTLKEAKKEFDEISIKLIEDYENQELIQKSSELSNFLDFHNAWDLENKIERVLVSFDLKVYEDRDISTLSGGEQRRVALASLILKKPDILLLDEPTNHLDVYMVEFLEEILKKEKFTILFISHDRYFIDNLATRVIEIDQGDLTSFNGGYKNYLDQKEQMLHNLQKSHENLLRTLKEEEEWYSRGVRARLKRNEGRKERLMQLREEAKSNPSLIRKMSLELQREQLAKDKQEKTQSKRKMLFELENIDLSFGNKVLIKNFNNRILQKDNIAIVGKNGAGKSTLLKILLGQLKIDAGKIKKGEFEIGYFDQQRVMLDDSKNLIETFCPNGGDRVDVQGRNLHVYGYLKNFLFPKEFLDKKIGTLSGGEKNRVALALLFTKKVDCLILDEPTNDLDIPTINILEEYLTNFSGALIFVSHDRYFVDKIAKKLFIFHGDGFIEESFSAYSDYLDIQKNINELEKLEIDINKEPTKPQQIKDKPKQKNKLSYKEQKEYDTLPNEIDELELKIEEINECLSNPKCYEENGITIVAKELEEIKEIYDTKVERYLELEELVESFLQ